jgi:hypothetical protein
MFALISFAVSFPERPGEVVGLSTENWDSFIGKKDSDAVWVVTFIDPSVAPCREMVEVVSKAARTSDALVNFGVVNVNSEHRLAMRFEVRLVPATFILHQNERSEYKGKRNASALIKAAVKFIPDKSLVVDADWPSDGQDTVILFTNKTVTPSIWAAVSCVFQGRARVGISSSRPMRKLFNIEKTPTILFQNRTYRTVYSGENSFVQLRKSIHEFLNREYEEPFHFASDFLLPEEFSEECKNFSGLCVVHVDADLDPKLKEVQQKFKNAKVKFFYGDEDLPYEFMQPGKVYVIQQQKSVGIALDSLSELAVTLSSVFDQSVKLVPLEDL